jgi:hypothetical protein
MIILSPTTPYSFLDDHQNFGRTVTFSGTQKEAAGFFEKPESTCVF